MILLLSFDPVQQLLISQLLDHKAIFGSIITIIILIILIIIIIIIRIIIILLKSQFILVASSLAGLNNTPKALKFRSSDT